MWMCNGCGMQRHGICSLKKRVWLAGQIACPYFYSVTGTYQLQEAGGGATGDNCLAAGSLGWVAWLDGRACDCSLMTTLALFY